VSMDIKRFNVLRAFGVAPWSEEAKGLTEDMVAEYSALLEDAEEGVSAAFNESFFSALSGEDSAAPVVFEETQKNSPKTADFEALSEYVDKALRCRDTGFICY